MSDTSVSSDPTHELTREPTHEFAQLDLERLKRRGVGEVIFGEGKRPHELAAIIERLVAAHGRALATRVSPTHYQETLAAFLNTIGPMFDTENYARSPGLPSTLSPRAEGLGLASCIRAPGPGAKGVWQFINSYSVT